MSTHLSRWLGVHDASELRLIALPRVDPASLHFDLRRICTTEWISVTRVDAGRRAQCTFPLRRFNAWPILHLAPGILFSQRSETLSHFSIDPSYSTDCNYAERIT